MIKINPFGGWITFSVIGAYYENFISELMESGIKVINIQNKENITYVDALRVDYARISKIAKNHRLRIKVIKRHGVYFRLRKISKRVGIVYGIIISAAIMIVMQQFVWRINIYGISELSDNLVLKTVSDSGINPGCLAYKVNTKQAEIRLKQTLKSVSWANIERNGSRIDIYIREANDVEKPDISLDTPCNVVADKSGVIIDTKVYSGTLLYNKGSGVSKGSVVVSGITSSGTDNIVLAHANAKIIAEFTEKVELRQEYTTNEKEKTGIGEIEKELMLLGFVIPLTNKINDYEEKICEEQIENCKLFGINMPWKIKTNTYTSYKDITITRTNEDVLRLLEQKLELYCINFFSEYEIINIIKSYRADENGISLYADVKLKGNIAVQQPILDKS